MSIMTDLGLHRKEAPNTKMAPMTNDRLGSKRNMQRTLDERRAYLGCYYLNCVYVFLQDNI
jgi:hypothetical protein